MTASRRPFSWLAPLLPTACCTALLAGFALLSSGCASSSSASLINLPDGRQGFTLNCSGSDAHTSWAKCYELAGQSCGASGYDVVSKDGDDAATGGSVNGVFSANIRNRTLVVRCH